MESKKHTIINPKMKGLEGKDIAPSIISSHHKEPPVLVTPRSTSGQHQSTERNTQATKPMEMQLGLFGETYLTSTSLLEASLANLSQLLDKGEVSRIEGVLSSLRSQGVCGISDHEQGSLRMLRDSFQHQILLAQDSMNALKEAEREQLQAICEESKTNPKESGKRLRSLFTEAIASSQSSANWMNWGMMRNGSFLTAKILESHRTDQGSSLSQVLETNPDSKYFLSDKAVQGIIRAMEKANRPILLQQSIEESGIQRIEAPTSSQEIQGKGILGKGGQEF